MTTQIPNDVLMDQIKRLEEDNKSLAEQLNRSGEFATLWQRRACETLNILHAFSAPMTEIIRRGWQAGL